ncbi:hypothetical protein SRHO_G00064350 [Serrasalmus rhombeus]
MKSEGMAWPQNSAELGQRGSQRGAAEHEEKAVLTDKTAQLHDDQVLSGVLLVLCHSCTGSLRRRAVCAPAFPELPRANAAFRTKQSGETSLAAQKHFIPVEAKALNPEVLILIPRYEKRREAEH